MPKATMNIEQITLVRTPEGPPREADFALGHAELAAPAEGQALVRVLALSLDPYLRSAMAGRHMSGNILPGEVVRGEGLVEVISSQHAAMSPGQRWVAECGWRSHALLSEALIQKARPVAAELAPATLALGMMGMPGLTAWAGFTKLCEPRAGQTLVVSAASGPVGATVGQLARIAGMRVVGIAGGAPKCDWAVKVAGFDACIDYKGANLRDELKRLCPGGVDVYFDNVGADMLQAVVEQLALNARVVLCGLIAQYGNAAPAGPNPAWFIKARATVRGLVVYDHWADMPQMLAELGAHLHAGRLHFREDRSAGLASAPAAFARLMRGENQGKSIVML
jgi:NADPH-dependent curcumin reductase